MVNPKANDCKGLLSIELGELVRAYNQGKPVRGFDRITLVHYCSPLPNEVL